MIAPTGGSCDHPGASGFPSNYPVASRHPSKEGNLGRVLFPSLEALITFYCHTRHPNWCLLA